MWNRFGGYTTWETNWYASFAYLPVSVEDSEKCIWLEPIFKKISWIEKTNDLEGPRKCGHKRLYRLKDPGRNSSSAGDPNHHWEY